MLSNISPRRFDCAFTLSWTWWCCGGLWAPCAALAWSPCLCGCASSVWPRAASDVTICLYFGTCSRRRCHHCGKLSGAGNLHLSLAPFRCLSYQHRAFGSSMSCALSFDLGLTGNWCLGLSLPTRRSRGRLGGVYIVDDWSAWVRGWKLLVKVSCFIIVK